jgi:hypothetical protein
MEYVATDIDNSGKFFYENGVYYKKDFYGKDLYKIEGQYLPDPHRLKLAYSANHNPNNPDSRCDASPVTYKLWEHWNGQQHN